MTNHSERSHDRTPFDSRRTKRVTLVTPRNPPAEAATLSPDPAEKDEAGNPTPSSADGD